MYARRPAARGAARGHRHRPGSGRPAGRCGRPRPGRLLAVAGRALGGGRSGGSGPAEGRLDLARARLPALVGRDPAGLDEAEIARAVVESVAENTVDAVVAPALWAAVGGAPRALGYRAVNTLDAMVGHRSPRYARFGWASARADDVADWVPARVTAALVVAVRPGSAARVGRAVRDDAPAHPSPNAGVAEAAFAAALGLRLGGANRYGDRVEVRPASGRGGRPRPATSRRARAAEPATSALALAGGLAAVGVGGRRRGRTPDGRPPQWPGRRRDPAPATTAATAPGWPRRLGLDPGRGARPVGQPQPGRPRPGAGRRPAPRRPRPLPRSAGRRPPRWPRPSASRPGRLLLTNGGSEAIALVAAELGPGWVDEPDFALYRRHLPVARPGAARGGGPTPTTRPAGWPRPARRRRSGTRPSSRWPPAPGPGATPAGRGRARLAHQAPGLPGPAARLRARARRRRPGRARSASAASPDGRSTAWPRRPARAAGRRSTCPAWAAAVARLRDRLAGLLRASGLTRRRLRRQLGARPTPRACATGWPRHAIVVRDCASFGLPDTVRIAVPDDAGLARLEAAAL